MLLADVHRYVSGCQKKRTSATAVITPGVPSLTDPNLQTARTLLPTRRGNSALTAGWGSSGSRLRVGCALKLTGGDVFGLAAGRGSSGSRLRVGRTLTLTGGSVCELTAISGSSRSRSRNGCTVTLTGEGVFVLAAR